MNKVTYYIAAMILGFSMSAQAQGARTKFKPSYAQEEVAAANEMSSAAPATQTMSQRAEVLNYRTIPNPMVTMEPTLGYVYSNFSGVSGINGASVDAVSRMQGGVGVLIGRGMWQGETGLLYSQRGGALNNALSDDGLLKVSADFTLSYIDLPLIARFSFPHSSKSHFFARAGVVVGFLTDAKYDAKISAVNYPAAQAISTSGIDAKDMFNSTDFRGVFGAGFDWKFSRNVGLIVQADFQESLSKINTDKFTDKYDVYNMAFALSTGVSIKL